MPGLELTVSKARESQQKRIEKEKRRKSYHDLQVQGTNNSSIVSKRSVEMLYTHSLEPEMGEWFKYFVPKGKRRSPAVNRGYWIRMETIKRLVLKIISSRDSVQHKVQVVNLGCGFDPLPFQLLNKLMQEDWDARVEFIDIDYPGLVKEKLAKIQDSQEITALLSKTSTTTIKSLHFCDGELYTDRYKLVGCDLNHHNDFETKLGALLEKDSIKIFIAEVSLAYMTSDKANKIIASCSRAENSHFLSLEQIIPSGKHHAFAQRMLYHFSHLRSPLQCVENYPTRKDQQQRYESWYPTVEIRNLFENWSQLISDELKSNVQKVEDFDEWEEFLVFSHHYVLIHGTNTEFKVYEDEPKNIGDSTTTIDKAIHFQHEACDNTALAQLKFPAITSSNDTIYIHGGLHQSRSDQTIVLKDNTLSILQVSGELPGARMCHTLTSIDDILVLTGGRSRPGFHLDDIFQLENHIWRKTGSLPQPRSRHCAVTLDRHRILIFGGLHSHCSKDDLFLVYDGESCTTCPMKVQGEISNLISCAMTYDPEANHGFIAGGFINYTIPKISNVLYRFQVQNDVVQVQKFNSNPIFQRVSCQISLITPTKILVVGGVSPLGSLNRLSTVVAYNLTSNHFQAVEIPQKIWESYPPMVIGSGLTPQHSKLYCLGGGAVCYSFGSSYNSIYSISI